MQNLNEGLLFDPALSAEIKDRFYYVDADPEFGQRLFFENSGGSLRLKASVEAQAKYQAFPDCPERLHDRSRALKKVQLHGIDDIMHIVFGASGGALISEMTASQAMFQIVGAILENCPGKSAVTSVLEHPSAYDAVKYYCDKTGKEFRVAQANPKTGGIDVEEIRRVVSPDTCLLSIMYASNITGSIMDMAGIVKAAREINPDIYIVTDAVQHAPHAVLDVDALGVDGATFAPYKFFGTRGMGYGYVSDRVAKLPHRKVLQRPADVWELGSPTPGNFAAMSAVVDYVCWLGGHFIQSDDRRTLFVTGMEHIHLQERALLHTMLEGTQNVPGLRHIPGVHVYVDTEDLTHRDLIVAMGIGTVLSKLLSLTGMTFPIYIGAMIAAAIIRNVGEYSGQYTVYMGEINDIGGICLSLFLGMAMITLKLWQLAELALPLIVLLAGQTLFMILYVVLVVFNIMGRDYDAAVIVSGTCGFGMGATPNAMANMQAICDKYSPSVKAYLLIPLVGSLFADFINSLVITVFINFI